MDNRHPQKPCPSPTSTATQVFSGLPLQIGTSSVPLGSRLPVLEYPLLPDRRPDAGRICNEKCQAVATEGQVERVAGAGQHVAVALVAGAVVVGGFGSWFHWLLVYCAVGQGCA